MNDFYIIIPGAPWGGQTAVLGPMDQVKADSYLEKGLEAWLPECPPKLVRVVHDYAEGPRP